MNNKCNKQQIMDGYYSDDELRGMKSVPVEKKLQWLVETNRFFLGVKGIDKILSEEIASKKIGW
ncbi:MAG: hypothetical protein ABIE84_04430 [bacterium]